MFPDVPDHIKAWYDDLIKVAIEKYNDGWDWIVECEDAYDLKREVENHGLTDWHQVLEHYTVAVANRLDRMEDIRAEGYEDNMTDAEADADALASAGWGTDEDYGYFGGDE